MNPAVYVAGMFGLAGMVCATVAVGSFLSERGHV